MTRYVSNGPTRYWCYQCGRPLANARWEPWPCTYCLRRFIIAWGGRA